MYVFHATLKQNQVSIDKNGLLLNQSKYNNRCYYVENQLFFTWISPKKAADIVLEMAKENPNLKDVSEDDIIVYAVDIHDFDLAYITYDYNYKCEDYTDIKSFAYGKPISADKLVLLSPKEYENEKYICKNNDLLRAKDGFVRDIGEKLADIYEEEIAWLYEKEEE